MSNAPRPYLELGFTDAVAAERRHQDDKWGPIDERDHTWPEWALILNREVGEANDTLGNLHWWAGAGPDTRYIDERICDARSELIQVAAVCAAIVELLDAALE